VLKSLIRALSILALCAPAAHTAFGQTTVTNPRIVEFDPSADHSTVSADGQPLVTRYDLQIYLQGAAQPVTTASLGKPALAADGKVRVDFSTILIGWPLADGTYEARVAAIGPTGNGVSDVSNLFAFQAVVVPPPCTYALSASTGTTGATGGPLSVTVTASAPTCGWTASSNAAWATVAPASGTGTGTAVVTLAANTGAARTATMTAGGQTYTVTQAAAPPPCSYTLSPTMVSAVGLGGASSVTITASASTCSWAASTATSWITLNTAAGTGSGPVNFTLSSNATAAARTGTLTVGGTVVTVSQAAALPPARPTGLQVIVK
jgi:hypothetical protein